MFNEIRKELKEDFYEEELSQIVKSYFEKFGRPLLISTSTSTKNGNIVKEQRIRNLDSKDNIVISDDIEISLLGVSDLVIVKEKDKLLIARKDRTQDIKKIIKIGEKL